MDCDFMFFFFFFQAEDGIRDLYVTGVQTCALPICSLKRLPSLVKSYWMGSCAKRKPAYTEAPASVTVTNTGISGRFTISCAKGPASQPTTRPRFGIERSRKGQYLSWSPISAGISA